MSQRLQSDEEYFDVISGCIAELTEAQILTRETKDHSIIWKVRFRDSVYTVIAGRKIDPSTRFEQPAIIFSWGANPLPFSIVCGGKLAYFDLKFRLTSRNLEGIAQTINERLKAHGLGMVSFEDYRRSRTRAQTALENTKLKIASALRRFREGKRSSTTVIFVGPIASGKTTQRLLLSKFLAESKMRAFTLTFPPFAFFTYALASIFKRIISISNVRSAAMQDTNIHPLDFLDEHAPRVLRRIIAQLTLVDSMQEIAFLMLAKILTSLGFCILIEDFTPTIELDHELFIQMYADNEKSRRLLRFRNMLTDIIQRMLPSRCVCVILQAKVPTRLERSVRRGYRMVDAGSIHDERREANLEKISRSMFEECILINTDGLSIKEVFQNLFYHLHFHDVID